MKEFEEPNSLKSYPKSIAIKGVGKEKVCIVTLNTIQLEPLTDHFINPH